MPTLVIACAALEFLDEEYEYFSSSLKDGWYEYHPDVPHSYQWWILT